MLYLLWALLNAVTFIFFLFICFKAMKLVRQEIGLFAAFVFVFGSVSFMTRHRPDKENLEPNSNQIKTWKFISPDSLDRRSNVYIVIDLEKTLISKYNLGIQYVQDNQLKNNIPVTANTSVTGLQGGTTWEPTSIIVNRTDDNKKFEYEVSGTVKWKLLGFTLYSQYKNWKGFALLK